MLRLFTDYRLGGKPRHYLAEQPEHEMIVPDEVRKCVVFIGYLKADDAYVKLGTAFFVSFPCEREDRNFVYLVTAKHIIANIRKKKLNKVFVRVNTYEGYTWIETSIDLWQSHTNDYNLDVSVLGLALRRELFDYLTIPLAMTATPTIIADYAIGVGEDVFLTGLFSKHTGREKNVPIIRTGSIALLADPAELVEVKIMDVRCEIEAHLIEARSIGGLSGSPVFVNLGHIRPVRSKPGAGQIYWLGLMHGHWDIEVRPDEYEEDDAIVPVEEKVNMGIAIVIPAYKVVEVIEQPYFADIRKRHNDEAREKDLPTPDMVENDDDNSAFTEDDFEKALEKASRPVKPKGDKRKREKSKRLAG